MLVRRRGADEFDSETKYVLQRLTKSKRLHLSSLGTAQAKEVRLALSALYQSELMSTAEIALTIDKSPSFVWSLCRKLGVKLRKPSEALLLAAPARIKTIRRPFAGHESETHYLQGFAEGDLDVRKPSRVAVMVSSTTTHPSFSACFRSMFENYGPIYHYPVFDKAHGYRWKLATRLDCSFSFLLPQLRKDYPEFNLKPSNFYSWLAGIVDTDGSVNIVPSGRYVKLTLAISNQDMDLLKHVKNQLESAGFHPSGPYLQAEKGRITKNWSIMYRNDQWNLLIQRAEEVRGILRKLPLRHGEKVSRSRIALGLSEGVRWSTIESQVRALQARIARQVNDYKKEAEEAYKNRGRGKANPLPFPILRQPRTS